MDKERLERELKKALKKVDLLEGFVEDKTRELYMAREQLKNTNVYLQAVIQSIMDALIVVNSEGRIQTVNKAAVDLIGLSEAELVGQPVQNIFLRGFVEGISIDELISKGFIKGIEKTYQSVKTGKVPLLFSSAVMRNGSNEVKGVVCVALDITERKELEEKIKTLAETDELTKIFNRRMFLRTLDLELSKAQRYSRPFSLILFDIDHFKEINDAFGHDVGDNVIKRVVEVARLSAREADILARYGGEEFMVIAPETGLDGAKTLAEKLRSRVQTSVIQTNRQVTISLGVTQWRTSDTADKIIKRADTALYKAKNNGRNKVETI